MSSQPVLTYRNGTFEIPAELRQEWHLHEGAKIRIVYAAGGKVLLDTAQPEQQTPADWRDLEGSLSHLSGSPNEGLEEDRTREFELDVRP